VLALLIFVLGPFALPLLWRSTRFSLVWKNILTALVLGLTVLLLWILWFVIQQVVGPLRQLEELLRR
jgi:nitrate/nitrite-specific signal transduction histidine kinase